MIIATGTLVGFIAELLVERGLRSVRGLDGMLAVLHAVGPFSATALPMAWACIEARVH